MKQQNVISAFMQNYHNKDNILGIIFYGSSNYKTDTINTDIDLLFITDSNRNYKILELS